MDRGTLFVVATPIGNLEDMTLRGLRILKQVDLIAAEDTRRTRILLAHYDIDTPLTSLHEHNERGKVDMLASRLLQGLSIACVSDAGTPGVSDPGYLLIKEALAQNIDVVTVPGPSAAIAALTISGLPMDSFTFQGFLPPRPGKRRTVLSSLRQRPETLVFFESPRRLKALLKDLHEILGDRSISLSREMTKLHEEAYRGTLSTVRKQIEHAPVKGEITIVVQGNREEDSPQPAVEDILTRCNDILQREQISVRDAAGRISQETGMPKRDVYRIILAHRQ